MLVQQFPLFALHVTAGIKARRDGAKLVGGFGSWVLPGSVCVSKRASLASHSRLTEPGTMELIKLLITLRSSLRLIGKHAGVGAGLKGDMN